VQPDARISIPPFDEHEDGDDVIIANAGRSCFLAVPREAVTLLHLLAQGHTLGETCALYEQAYGIKPDIEDFIETLTSEGFITIATTVAPAEKVSERHYHFDNIPVTLAKRICSWPALAGCAVLVALAIAACAIEPTLIPTPAALVFEQNPVPMALALFATSIVTLFVHELAHLLAARAAGVPSRIGLGNRLWILVAETDMTGIWLASPAWRCIAFLAGPLFDLTLSAALVIILFGAHHGWLQLGETLQLLLRANLFVGLTRILWQFYLFVPTDFYYVLGTLFHCKSLMHDTQTFLLNQLLRAFTYIQPRDQSQVPAKEMRVVRVFAWIWVAGRALAFGTLFAITVPVLVGYGAMLGRGLTGDMQALRPILEGPGLPIMAIALQTTGIVMWLRGVFRARGTYA
jgi:hypothetical protein